MLHEIGAALVGRMCVEPYGEGSSDSKAGWGRHPPPDVGTGRPRVDGLLCRGKLWFEERTPEQLKGEGE